MNGNQKTAGVLGGMGPEATVDLLARVVKLTDATDDQDHVRCLVDQNPRVPSRIKYLLEGGYVSPGPCLAEMARNLERIGADFLCIPCNTAHHWHGEVAAAVDIPVLNIASLASRQTAALLSPAATGRKRVGILASPAVRLTGVYDAPCAEFDLLPVYADDDYEQRLLALIKAIKAGDDGPRATAEFAEIVRHFEEKGADALIVACTELSMLDCRTDLPVIDAADALAREIVTLAGAKLKN